MQKDPLHPPRRAAQNRAHAKKSNRFRTRGLPAAASALAVGAIAGEASATIQVGLGSFSQGSTFSLNGAADIFGSITLTATSMGASDDLSLVAAAGAMMTDSTVEFSVHSYTGGGAMDTANYLDQFQNDGSDTIDASLTNFSNTGYLSFHSFVDSSNWAVGDNAFIGFRFDPLGGTDWLYGWLQLTFTDTKNLTVSQWAFEDDAFVGGIQVGMIPEPGTALLLGLGLVGLGLGARRRRSHARSKAA